MNTDASTFPPGGRTIVDGCTAAAYVAYAMSEVATVYPITPVAGMGQTAQQWAVAGRLNVYGRPMKVVEMESELGAAGATHGALSAGVTATTFTASQGLLLMIPNMYKMAGELLPAVFHVGCRSIATHALSIFGDHQDAMACRGTGFAFLMSNTVQEAADMALVAHLSAMEGSLPVVHMFDGWRTGNEMSTVELPSYSAMASLVDKEALARFRARGMNPLKPDIRGTAQNPDVFFQNREAANRFYDAFPAIVSRQMERVGQLTGRHYGLYDYEGAPDADRVLVMMGSGCEVAAEAVRYLNTQGYKTGVVKVRLFRPFAGEELLKAIPSTARMVAVMDRCKEPGSEGEPLYLDVASALMAGGRGDVKLTGGRYGLSSKDFSPSMVRDIFDSMPSMAPGRKFTVGITDDVTRLSLSPGPRIATAPGSMRAFQFYGMGSDGTVGATRQAAQILSELTGDYVQAFFDYSAKKSGGYTVSSLRMDRAPVTCEYAIERADYVGVNKQRYIKLFDIAPTLAPGGILTVNTAWDAAGINAAFPAALKRAIASRGVRLYTIDAAAIAARTGLGVRINTVMETVFLKLCGLTDFASAVGRLKAIVTAQYIHEGQDVVDRNLKAIDMAADSIVPVAIPADWATASPAAETAPADMPPFVRDIAMACLRRQGDRLPVSALSPDGFVPPGESRWEKRAIALNIPRWVADKCVECTMCSLVCAHAAIRPALLTADEAKDAPFDTRAASGTGDVAEMRWRIQVYPRDCTGCGSCAAICPGHALVMEPMQPQSAAQQANLQYVEARVAPKEGLLPRFSLRGSQMYQPLLEFSGACGGCGETPYVKLLTQLFGERMVVANATGCSSIWGADYPSMPYTANRDGHGPAWGNSLFEDNAEYGYGIALGLQQRTDLGVKPSVWAIGGDGWAYDIGFGGLDHVIAQNVDINILVMDTECYSNTGGQMSKATPLGAVAKYAPDGKRTVKKDLGRMAMTYGHVFVGSISLAADPAQAIDVLRRAEAYPGPSLVIAYCPCINHGIRAGMGNAAVEMRRAVKCGYWPLWYYDPADTAQPLHLQSAAPDGSLPGYLDGESRYADLVRLDPKAAATLRPELGQRLAAVYDLLKNFPSHN